MKSKLLCLVAVSVQIVFATAPQVKNVKAMQQYPWGKLYISYEVVGDVAANATKGMRPFLLVAAKDKTNGNIYATATSLPEAEHFLSGDIGSEGGLHNIIWDIGAQGKTINSTNIAIVVAYWDEVYMIIDLSAGANASSYPISYLYNVPSGGWSDTYKTTKLVLRRIAPGSVNTGGSNITLTEPFYMGIFEVTQKQYLLVTGSNPSQGTGDKLPVQNVSYKTIRGSATSVGSYSFMGKLRLRTGLDFDLPRGTQWEYSCRAGTTTTYSYGNSANGDYMWYSANNSSQVHEVGTKLPNPWGLYDMHGNVSEWCHEAGSESSLQRHRGGSWQNRAEDCTSSSLQSRETSFEHYTLGFRLVGNIIE